MLPFLTAAATHGGVLALILSISFLTVPSSVVPAQAQNGWAKAKAGSKAPPRVIGSYTNGCIDGAKALPLKGRGWRVIRAHRNRNWGHPDLIAFVKRLGTFAADSFERPILVADIAQPRGGPITGHASHEIGLDADIRLLLLKPNEISKTYLRRPPNVSMLTAGRGKIDRDRWSSRQVKLIRFAARDPGVDRIFVNPVIKRELCRTVTKDRSWLGKVVPWYGHDAHMHIRMSCPAGSPKCRPQKAIPAGDGCGKPLTWWFQVALPRARSWLKRAKKRKPAKRRYVAPPVLPAACAAVLKK